MSHSPETPGMMSVEKMKARLAQIDQEHFKLTESLDAAPAKFQESTQGDDDATENEPFEQELGSIRRKIEELERERDELHAQLGELEKAA